MTATLGEVLQLDAPHEDETCFTPVGDIKRCIIMYIASLTLSISTDEAINETFPQWCSTPRDYDREEVKHFLYSILKLYNT